MLQRAGCGGGGQPAGGCRPRRPGPHRQAAASAHAEQDRRPARGSGQGYSTARRYRIFRPSQRRGLRGGKDRATDRTGPPVAPPVAGRALCPGSATAECPHAGRGDDPPPADARRQDALPPAQADARTGLRDHQVGAWVSTVPAPRDRQRPRRVEPRDHSLEHETDVRPEGRKLSIHRTIPRQSRLAPPPKPKMAPETANAPTKPQYSRRKRSQAQSRRHGQKITPSPQLRQAASVPKLKFAIGGERQVLNTSSLFSVACWSRSLPRDAADFWGRTLWCKLRRT